MINVKIKIKIMNRIFEKKILNKWKLLKNYVIMNFYGFKLAGLSIGEIELYPDR